MSGAGAPAGGSSEAAVGDAVPPAEAVAALRRVLSSEVFRRAPRSRDFLAYIVAESLAGRSGGLHERTVARYALGRDADFDGQGNAVARVRATRVRRALEAYYRGEGRGDPVRIGLPPGGYVPAITREPAPPSDTVVDPTLVAVVAVHTSEGDEITVALGENVAARLARFPGLTVTLASRQTVPDPIQLGGELCVRFVLLCATAGSPEAPVLRLQLYDCMEDRLLWADGEAVSVADDTLSAVDRWATVAAAQLGDYCGLILRQALALQVGTNAETQARLAFYAHIGKGHAESMLTARRALEAALGEGSADPEIHAMYAFILGILALNGHSADTEADISEAQRAARRALAADPTSALAHLGLGAVALYRNEWERCREEALRATEISPGHPSHLFTAGGLLASVGDWSEGVELMRRSFALNPLHPPYQHGNLALERLMAGDLAGALAEASIVDDGGGVWGPFCRALALEGLGHHDQARTEMTKALQYAPALIEDPDTLFGATVLDDTQRATLLTLLEPFR